MKIQSLNNFSAYSKKNNPQFKSVYPVVHWVAETNSSYVPAIGVELNKKMQRTIVSLFNGTNKLAKTPLGQRVKEYLAKCDIDYRRKNVTRSFYDTKGGWKDKFEPVSYLITGSDVNDFNQKYGKNIGKAIAEAPVISGKHVSAELERAKRDYSLSGKSYVKSKENRIYDSEGVECSLHTKFQTIRSKSGKIKGYELIDIRFCPDKGSNNPFVKVGLVKE